MSRIAKAPVVVPSGVDILLESNTVTVKGSKGQLSYTMRPEVSFSRAENVITMVWNQDDKFATAHAGTARSILSNMVVGVSTGFEKKLALVGVGYRAQEKDNVLTLTLGYSHPIEFQVPAGVSIETPTQTDVIVKGCNKQLVGEVAAKIRSYRPPEPYKGKGVRYADEHITKKEAKKK